MPRTLESRLRMTSFAKERYTFGVNSRDNAYQTAYKNFLARLIEARKQAGITQVDVAKRLGKAHSFISKCELARDVWISWSFSRSQKSTTKTRRFLCWM